MSILKRMGIGIGLIWALLSGICFVVAFCSTINGTFTPGADLFAAHPLACCAVVVTLAGAFMGLCMGES